MIYEPESEWLLANYPHIFSEPDGVYVDLGCAHPIVFSQTSFLRDMGWKGLAVDGNPDYAKDWADAGFASHFYHALLSWAPRARFVIHDNSQTSRISDSPETDRPEKWGINRVVEMDTTPIQALLDLRRIRKVNLLSLDLEGMEYHALMALDLKKHDPMFIIGEYATQEMGNDLRVLNYLLINGYQAVHMTAANVIYLRI